MHNGLLLFCTLFGACLIYFMFFWLVVNVLFMHCGVQLNKIRSCIDQTFDIEENVIIANDNDMLLYSEFHRR